MKLEEKQSRPGSISGIRAEGERGILMKLEKAGVQKSLGVALYLDLCSILILLSLCVWKSHVSQFLEWKTAPRSCIFFSILWIIKG